MSPGIRATVTFESADACPLASLSGRAGTTIDSVSTSVTTDETAGSVTEFRLTTDGVPTDECVAVPADDHTDGSTDDHTVGSTRDTTEGSSDDHTDGSTRDATDGSSDDHAEGSTRDPAGDSSNGVVSPVISYGSVDVFSLDHAGGDRDQCPCECLGAFGRPVERYVADEGVLTLVFHAPDFDSLQEIVAALRDRFPGIDVRRLVRDPGDEGVRDDVFVDRKRLTDRQLEVLRTAYEMGYFERPKGANASDVAGELDVNSSTFAEHLAAAQRKVFGDVLE